MGFGQLDPLTGAALEPLQTNVVANFGFEYVWHCHILSHEENDMMRSIVFLPSHSILWYNTTSGDTWNMSTTGTQATTTGTIIYTEASTGQWSIVGKGDFNGDSVIDSAWWNNVTGQVRIMLMANPDKVLSQTIVQNEPDVTNWHIVATGDLNGDGRSDLIWWNKTSGQVFVWNIGGSFTTPVFAGSAHVWTEPDTNWKIVAADDLNGDGKADLVWWNGSTGQVFAMLMNGTAVSSSAFVWTEPDVINWRIAGTGDLDGDGKADIVWRNRTTGMVFAMLMNGTTVSSNGVPWTEPDINWEIVGINDFTADTKADLLWRHKTTGLVFLTPLNGLSAITGSSAVIWNEPTVAWRIEDTTEWRNNVYGVGVTTP
jgi:hypothetical protein